MLKNCTIAFIVLSLISGAFFIIHAGQAGSWDKVKVSEGKIELPSYEFSGRELEPTLFQGSNIRETYPFVPYKRPYKKDGPKTVEYDAIIVENEYLEMTVVPDFGGRVYSLYDKVNKCEVFYKNDVLKYSGVNSKGAWPVGNIELTGPHDAHMLSIFREPLWFNKVIENEDGSASVVMSNIDPYYRMKVNFIARLVPGRAAMEITVFCYNRNDSRKPYMFWVNAGVPQNDETRFIYPMTRTIGHTTAEVASWPYYSGSDYSWLKNNKHMLGVFGIDVYDNFLGAYDYAREYGTFRYGDRRVMQGMKTWTWGTGPNSKRISQNYTDNAGPYIEIQSGRYTWDGHYEWLIPHYTEGWTEWWLPASGIKGLTTTNLDLALCLDVNADSKGKKSSIKVGLSATKHFVNTNIKLFVNNGKQLFETVSDIAPGESFNHEVKNIAADSTGLQGMQVVVVSESGDTLLNYLRPDEDPGRKDYTPFTRPIDSPQKKMEEMTTEELLVRADTKFKEMQESTALSLLASALEDDPGLSRAHLMLGIYHYENGRQDSAVTHFEKVIERDPYKDEAYYYYALAKMEHGDTLSAERHLYYIPPISSYYTAREYLLGRIAWHRGNTAKCKQHLRQSLLASGYNLDARNMLATVCRLSGRADEASRYAAKTLEIDPTDRWAIAELWFVSGQDSNKKELSGLLGGQAQEAIELGITYRKLGLWDEAVKIMKLVEEDNNDVFGTPSIYYYTLAYCLKSAGREKEAVPYYSKAVKARKNIDRYPFRPESLLPLSDALVYNPEDEVAHYFLGCLQYHLGEKESAIAHWDKAVEIKPDDFSFQRTLGMAYAENGRSIVDAGKHLEKAIELNPSHIRTFSDLSHMYSRHGLFDNQESLVMNALKKSPGNDNLIEQLINVNLIRGDLEHADSLIVSHQFAQRHRSYSLRDKYRFLRYGEGARAFSSGDYKTALEKINSALFPPSSLGADDFEYQTAPRVHYYTGLAYERLGKKDQAEASFKKAIQGWNRLAGDRDSFNHENLYMALALKKLGMPADAKSVISSMENFARGQIEIKQNRRYRAENHYLLALVLKDKGQNKDAREHLKQAIQLLPGILGPRFELRGDVPDPMPETN
jgi:tetratricopeptide (TPR) repeat protein